MLRLSPGKAPLSSKLAARAWIIHEGAIMPHSQMIISKKANSRNLAPRLRLANQTEKLLRYCPMRRFDIERGIIRRGSLPSR
jgi:hypothetical protein